MFGEFKTSGGVVATDVAISADTFCVCIFFIIDTGSPAVPTFSSYTSVTTSPFTIVVTLADALLWPCTTVPDELPDVLLPPVSAETDIVFVTDTTSACTTCITLPKIITYSDMQRTDKICFAIFFIKFPSKESPHTGRDPARRKKRIAPLLSLIVLDSRSDNSNC